jgi:hypothetical protein
MSKAEMKTGWVEVFINKTKEEGLKKRLAKYLKDSSERSVDEYL